MFRITLVFALLFLFSCSQRYHDKLINNFILVTGILNATPNHHTLASAEVYDSGSKTFHYTNNSLEIGRYLHSATILTNGKVLIAGGCNGSNCQIIADSRIYDPSTNSFKQTSNMNIARNTHSAVLLQDGRVLITGGVCLAGLQPTNTSEIYDPTTEKFTNTGSLNFARCSHKSYLLSSGKILIIGGHNPASLTNTNVDILSQSEIYDPQTGQFTLSGNEVIPRTNFRDYVFPNGSILLLGGFTKDNTYLSSTEIFNVNTSTFSLSSNMNFNKLSFGVSALCNGQLLTTGGISFNNSNKSIAFYSNAEIYDPVTSSFSISSASMSIQRYDHSNTILNDCSVLIAGGGNSFTSPYATNKAEIYDATQKKFITVGNLNDARKSHTATMLNNGKVLIVGGTIDY